nr:MAG: capsid protein [ssDNA virus sp.]
MPRIPVESKHTYYSYNANICGINNPNDAGAGAVYNPNRPVILFDSPLYPVTGTDESNRIGRKIRTDSLVSEFFLSLYNTLDNDNLNTIYDYYAYHNSDVEQKIRTQVSPQQPAFNTNEQNLDVSIRHMIVEFDPEIVQGRTDQDLFNYLWNWYIQLHIWTGTDNIHSNRQQVKRESTEFTGNFHILLDKVIHLDLKHPIYHGNVVVPYVRHLNFDGVGAGLPTNKLVYEIFIGPTNVFVDYGSQALGEFIANNPPVGAPNLFVAHISNTIKLNYTDL